MLRRGYRDDAAGSFGVVEPSQIGDAVFDEIFHPIARELIGKCDAVLRIGGPSTGADDMVATGQKLGKKIYRSLEEIPKRTRS